MVRGRAQSLGAVGTQWLADLPATVAGLERAWGVTVGDPVPGLGTSSYVAHATTADGVDVIVKVSLPDPTFARQARTLSAAAGRGYVHLLEYDPAREAVLLEALGPTLADVEPDPVRQIEIMCDLLPLAWAVPPPPAEPAYDKAASLHRLVARLAASPNCLLANDVVAIALTYAEARSRALDPQRCVVVHGDPAGQNTLRVRAPRPGAAGGYVFVDPDGFLGDPAYDLGVVLREWGEYLLAGHANVVARRFCRVIADRTGMDEEAIWQWGFLERVSTGLYAHSFGADDLARPFLASAIALVR